MKRLFMFVALMASFYSVSSALASPEGIWLRSNQETKIQIAKCGNAYCGTTVWMIASKRDKKDRNNPDPDLQNRSVIGIMIFDDMVKDGDNTYTGTLYNPEDGKTYSGTLTVLSDSKLKLKGCVIWPLCKSDTWSRTTLAVNSN